MSVAPDFPIGVQQLSLSFDPDAMGRPQPWTAHHRGLEYLGIGAVAEAMREYNKRLSTHAARQIMADPSKEQVARFIDLVQAADPSSLVNVLDEQVVDFLRQFMRAG